MSVPRAWWERALETGRIDDSYIQILQELCAELQAVPVLTGRVEVAALVAWAFADDEAEEREPKFGTVYSQHTIEEYLSRAKEVMKSRPAIRKLREMIARNAGFPA